MLSRKWSAGSVRCLPFLVFLLQLGSHQERALAKYRPPNRRTFYLLVWAGPANWTAGANDTLAVYRVNTAAKSLALVFRVDVRAVGNEPYYFGFNKGKGTFVTSGLLSYLRDQPSVYLWSTVFGKAPRLVARDSPPNCTAVAGSCPLPDGGLLVACMGGAGGGPGGQVVRYSRRLQRVSQFPATPQSLLAASGPGFQPHSLVLSNDRKYLLTADWLVPNTSLGGTPGDIVRYAAVRVWSFQNLTLLATFQLPTSPRNSLGAFEIIWAGRCGVVTVPSTGQIYCVDPYANKASVIYDFGDPTAQPLDLIANDAQNIIFASLRGLDRIYKFVAAKLTSDSYLTVSTFTQLPVGSGPNRLALTADQTVLVVACYFLDEKNAGGAISYGGDNQVRFLSTSQLQEMPSLRINLNTSINPQVAYRPGGIGVFPVWTAA